MKKTMTLALLLLTIGVSAQTNFGGTISVDSTLTLVNSPYTVTNNVLVQQGVTLTLEAGVELNFDKDIFMQIEGTLRAIGTSSDPVVINGNPATWATGYSVLRFKDTAEDYDTLTGNGCYLSYCILTEGKDRMIRMENMSLKIDHSHFKEIEYAILTQGGPDDFLILENNHFMVEHLFVRNLKYAILRGNELTGGLWTEVGENLDSVIMQHNCFDGNNFNMTNDAPMAGDISYNSFQNADQVGMHIGYAAPPLSIHHNVFDNNYEHLAFNCQVLDSLDLTNNNFLNFTNYMITISNGFGCNGAVVDLHLDNNYWNGLTPAQLDAAIYDNADDFTIIRSVVITNPLASPVAIDSIGCAAPIFIDCDTTDCVWPGDANYDGVANVADVVRIGLTYGDSGPTRAQATTNWTAQPATDWSNSTLGVNHKHSDCDGNGMVEVADVIPVGLNYGMMHNKSGARNDGSITDPPLNFVAAGGPFAPGDTVLVEVHLGDVNTPATAYGLAFSVIYDPALIDSGSIEVNFDNSWLIDTNETMVSLTKDFYDNGQLDIGFARTDHANKTGYGRICAFSIIMEDNLDGKDDTSYVLPISFEAVYVADELGDSVLVNPTNDSLIIAVAQETGISNMDGGYQLRVYPNPARDKFVVQANGTRLQSVSLLNTLGQTVYTNNTNQPNLVIPTDGLTNGIYFVTVHTPEGRFVERIMINKR